MNSFQIFYRKSIVFTSLCNRKYEFLCDRKGVLDIRFGQEDNTYNRNHPCPGLFETCCTLKTEKPILPPNTQVNTRCGIRNVNGVGFRITGDKDGEAQFGMQFFFIIYENAITNFNFQCR